MKLVTAIMPTRGREPWAAMALDSFLRQTYANKQLLILDDSDEPSFRDSVDCIPHVSYLRLDDRLNIPQKRNLLCKLAAGEIICHWDSDDYSTPDRILDEVERLHETGKAMTGYSTMLFYDPALNAFGRYAHGPGQYALGSSLCYFKSWWRANPFNEGKNIGEDNDLVARAVAADRFVCVEGQSMMVARVHAGNTSKKNIGDYRPVELESIPKGFLR